VAACGHFNDRGAHRSAQKDSIFNALDEAKYDWKSLNWQTVKKVELVELAVPVLREAKRLPKAMKVL
jgi:hypothetical protein